MIKKIVTTALVIIVAVGALTGCAVSSDEQAICEAEGGKVTSERFSYKGELGDFWAVTTGLLHYCETSSGMSIVYNEIIEDVKDGLFSPTNNNVTIFNDCTKLGGATYRTVNSNGKTSSTRYVCIVDRAYVQILK